MEARRNPAKTVIVFGAARGGTSMTAGVLSCLGVHMGEDEAIAPFYEHRSFAKCFLKNDKVAATTIARELDQEHPVWEVKSPHRQLWRWRNIFREPVYLVVFRDLVATANKRRVSLRNIACLPEMFHIGAYFFFLLSFLRLS